MTCVKSYERVKRTFLSWKHRNISNRCALYHTGLEIEKRRGGMGEKVALLYLRLHLRFAEYQ
jgi:hypothetical protein